jgi:hypothetical protein
MAQEPNKCRFVAVMGALCVTERQQSNMLLPCIANRCPPHTMRRPCWKLHAKIAQDAGRYRTDTGFGHSCGRVAVIGATLWFQ